jgi:hypothetical protein
MSAIGAVEAGQVAARPPARSQPRVTGEATGAEFAQALVMAGVVPLPPVASAPTSGAPGGAPLDAGPADARGPRGTAGRGEAGPRSLPESVARDARDARGGRADGARDARSADDPSSRDAGPRAADGSSSATGSEPGSGAGPGPGASARSGAGPVAGSGAVAGPAAVTGSGPDAAPATTAAAASTTVAVAAGSTLVAAAGLSTDGTSGLSPADPLAIDGTAPGDGATGPLSPAATLAERASLPPASARATGAGVLPADAGVELDAADALDAWMPAHAPARVDRARLVVGDDGDRVVVAVALRHGTVDVAIRADDQRLARELAATRDELDGALGRHGLALGDHAAGQRGDDHRPPADPPPPTTHAAGDHRDDEPAAIAPHRHDPHLRARA